jgi:serine/threonine-protein kinase
VGGYFLGRHQGWWGSSAKTLTVPTDLPGKAATAAQSELAGLGFTNVTTSRTHSATVPAESVISSNPTGGTKIKSDDPLVLSVSTGPTSVQVPSVAGLDQATAVQHLAAAGFKTAPMVAYSATVPQGTVISTDPAGGTQAPQGSLVKVMVSNGVQPVQVPSVVGQSPAQAGAALQAAGLRVGPTQQQSSSSVGVGLVTGTNPAAGTTVPTGSSVTIYVSSGPPTTSVPNLIGDTPAQAQAALAAAGLQGQQVGAVPVSSPGQDGLVVTQNPASGSTQPQNTTVQYQVGRYTAPATTTTTATTSTTTTAAAP